MGDPNRPLTAEEMRIVDRLRRMTPLALHNRDIETASKHISDVMASLPGSQKWAAFYVMQMN